MPKMDASAPISTLPICPVLTAKPWAPKTRLWKLVGLLVRRMPLCIVEKPLWKTPVAMRMRKERKNQGERAKARRKTDTPRQPPRKILPLILMRLPSNPMRREPTNEADAVGGGQEAHESSADV